MSRRFQELTQKIEAYTIVVVLLVAGVAYVVSRFLGS